MKRRKSSGVVWGFFLSMTLLFACVGSSFAAELITSESFETGAGWSYSDHWNLYSDYLSDEWTITTSNPHSGRYCAQSRAPGSGFTEDSVFAYTLPQHTSLFVRMWIRLDSSYDTVQNRNFGRLTATSGTDEVEFWTQNAAHIYNPNMTQTNYNIGWGNYDTGGGWHEFAFHVNYAGGYIRFWKDQTQYTADTAASTWNVRFGSHYSRYLTPTYFKGGVTGFLFWMDDIEIWDGVPDQSVPEDAVAPSIVITNPTSEPTLEVEETVLQLSGTASDNIGVQVVTWSNSRGGSGNASGAENWTISEIPLSAGENVVQVLARDAAGNVGTDTITVTAPSPAPDTTPPVLSAISASSVGATAVTITWSSNEPATSQVEYGLSTSYGSSTSENSTLASTHTVTLSGLTPETTYHFRVRSRDEAGNATVSGDGQFTTTAVPGGVLIDNLTPSDYEIDTIGVGVTVYLDRLYPITSLPAEFEGLQFIRGKNDDRFNTSEDFLRFRVDRAVKVYVCYASDQTPPTWLSSFQNTGLEVSRLYLTLDVYVKEFPAGEIVLGGNMAAGSDGGVYGMYFVMIEPADSGGGDLPGKPGQPFVIGK